MDAAKKISEEDGGVEEDIGFMMWKLESIGKFYPCYKTLLEQD